MTIQKGAARIEMPLASILNSLLTRDRSRSQAFVACVSMMKYERVAFVGHPLFSLPFHFFYSLPSRHCRSTREFRRVTTFWFFVARNRLSAIRFWLRDDTMNKESVINSETDKFELDCFIRRFSFGNSLKYKITMSCVHLELFYRSLSELFYTVSIEQQEWWKIMCKNVYISAFVNRKIAKDLFHQVENREQKFHSTNFIYALRTFSFM